MGETSVVIVMLGPCLKVYQSVINNVKWRPSHGMGLKLRESLVVSSLTFCSTFSHYTFYRQDKLCAKGFVARLVFQSFHCKSSPVIAGDQFRLHIPITRSLN